MAHPDPARPALSSAFMPLVGTTSAFLALIAVGFAIGGAAIMTMM
jgi:hypothetical protein